MESRTHLLKRRMLEAPFEVCPERAVLWTESMRRTEGKHQVIRNAMALKNVLDNMSVTIRDGELIVGNRTSKLKGAPLFPETKSFSFETQLDTYETRPVQPFRVDSDTKRALKKVLPYWRGKSAWEMAFRLMPPDLQLDVYKLIFTVEAEFANGIGHFIVGNPNLLKKGFAGIRDQASEKLSRSARQECRASHSRQECRASDDKVEFWKAIEITSDAAMNFAARYSDEARKLAGLETDATRKKELETIAEVCARVSKHAPTNFHEALQAAWFNQLICQIECGGYAISAGRLDQLLYPFYRDDIERGKITSDEARELIECYYVKLSELVNVLDTITISVTSGMPTTQALTIGGTDEEGADATNELSHLFLEAHDSLRTVWPNLEVRLHPKTPDDFSMKVYDAVRRGAMMSLFNDEVIVPALEARGITTPEARNYAIVGCVEPTTAGSSFCTTDSNLFNIARCLELALHNGEGLDAIANRKFIARRFNEYLKPNGNSENGANRTKNVMLLKYFSAMARRTNMKLPALYKMLRGKNAGVRSGDPRTFKSIDDFLEAYKKQVSHFVERMVLAMDYVGMAHAELKPLPFISSTIDDCIGRGKDVTWGGARYSATSPQGIGLAEVADSLAAIKELVFDKKKITIDELLEAIENNFEGFENLRQMLIHKAPKYGNDEEDADTLAKQAADIYCHEVSKHKCWRGGTFSPGIYSISSYIAFGIFTGATPDGRRLGDDLACGVSPKRGAELKGPTAVMRSVSCIDATQISNGYVLNMKFHPQLLEGDEKLKKFADLNQAYFRLGGMHVQHNVVDAETLHEAQNNPDKHRGLVVRVAGYSALFTDLDRATQDDIIKRTAHGI